MEQKIVYADQAATTPMSNAVWNAMAPYFREQYGNPSAVYSIGRNAKRAIETAREQCAAALGANNREIFFTAGGSESDNWALRGVMERQMACGKNHLITTIFEHHAILHTCQYLEQRGVDVTYLPVNRDGFVSPEQIEQAIRSETGLVSIMYANNEIGTIQPIEQIGTICRMQGVLFHTDAVQAVGNIPIHVKEQKIDLLSLSGHKIHGPKGVGLLYVREGVPISPLIYGGSQESGMRAGTENVPAAVGLGKAMELACGNIPAHCCKVGKMRDRLMQGLSKISGSHVNGSIDHRLCGNLNISFEGIEGESLLLMLDLNGICASSGSACTTGQREPSHVLQAIGLPEPLAKGSLRLTLGDDNSDSDVDRLVEVIPHVIEQLRTMSPI